MDESNTLIAGTSAYHRTLLKNVYWWMTLGLALSALVARWSSSSPLVQEIFFNRGLMPLLVLAIGAFVLVFSLSRNIMNMSVSVALGAFLLYSIVNGVLLSFIFLIYMEQVVYQVFFICSGMFCATSLWAVLTRRDLSGWGHYLSMGLIGLIIAGFVGFFVDDSSFHFLYSAFGVILFTALTAFDTQKIKRMSDSLVGETRESDFMRLSILGALKLYLDFVNMFLFLLRILGRRR